MKNQSSPAKSSRARLLLTRETLRAVRGGDGGGARMVSTVNVAGYGYRSDISFVKI